ncbi:MAG: UDP-N-acetylmuramoyl-tripeptide--D-alanyl-D-alanine ligase [Verrucomicrobiales bacterium]
MRPLTLSQITGWVGGVWESGQADPVVKRVSTDSRENLKDALFVPLIGERHDAHTFLDQAFANGAAAALCARPSLTAGGPLVRVDDTLVALQRLATMYRASLSPFLAIGVTGSNGKTSTKDLLAGVLAQSYAVHATRGNLNNHIGVPLTVLGIEPHHTAGIFEMGMNHFGEIAPLAAIAQPRVAVITNIGTAHIEFLGSREGIALEKGRLIEAIPADGFVVLNADDDMTPSLAARSAAPVITAGLTAGQVRAQAIHGSSFELALPGHPPLRTELTVPGRHMIGNALLAAAVAWRLGLPPDDIRHGLQTSRLHAGRLQFRETGGLRFLDDSYNANPDSMAAALRTLADQPVAGRRIAVLGGMGELGSHAAEGHRAVGRAAADTRVDFLLTVGDDDSRLIHHAFAQAEQSHHCASAQEAAAWLRSHASPADLILLKGSRSAAMERVLAVLSAAEAGSKPPPISTEPSPTP